MGLRINTNVLSLNAQRSLMHTTKALSRSLERLSSGSRINRAGDDAAGLAISEGLNSQVRGLRQAVRNANDSLGFLNTAEGALAEMTNLTQRLRELAIQAANGAIGNKERGFLNDEMEALLDEMNRIANQTEFNGTKLLDGTFTQTDLQVGVNKGDTIGFTIGDARTSQLGALAIVSGAQNNLSQFDSLKINDQDIAVPSGLDSVSTLGKNYSALAVAKSINAQSGITNVQATALETRVDLNNLKFSRYKGSIDAGDFVINGVNIVGAASSLDEFVAIINEGSSTTGVKARISGSNVELYATDGRNIEIDLVSGGTALTSASTNKANAIFLLSSNTQTASARNVLFTAAANISSGLTDRLLTGAVELRSSEAIIVANGDTGAFSTAVGFSDAVTSVGNDAVNTISVATQADAQSALSVVDATLSQLNELRSSLGAVQNRLDSTIRNISIGLENISSAQSQIRDADIAQETAELTRAQILQQAGVAVLGQANASSQVALGLLQF